MPRLVLFCLLSGLSIGASLAQTKRIDSLPQQGVLLLKGWKYHPGDNPGWASPSFDDQSWKSINPALPANQQQQVPLQGIGWLRLHLRVNEKLSRQPLFLRLAQACASEIYLNGRLLSRLGKVSAQPHQTVAYTTVGDEPIGVVADGLADQVVAIRIAPAISKGIRSSWLPTVRLLNLPALLWYQQQQRESDILNAIGFGICLFLSLSHIAFFLFNPDQRANLYFTFFMLCLGSYFLSVFVPTNHTLEEELFLLVIGTLVIQMSFLWPLRALYALFGQKPRRLYYGLWLFLPVSNYALAYSPEFQATNDVAVFILCFLGPILIALIEQLRLTWQGVRRKKRGAGIIACGFAGSLLVLGVNYGLTYVGFLSVDVYHPIFPLLLTLSPVFGISLYLSREFALDSQLLQVKLIEVQQLSAQTIAQEQEKQHLLASQNETLEQQVEARTAELNQSLTNLKATQAQLIQKEKMASLGELTAGIAHEIQNPLNFVNNFSEVSAELVTELEEEQLKPDRNADLEADLLGDLKQNLQKITQHGSRASAIVRGMLEHSRSSTEEKRPTDLNALADEYLKIAFQGLRAKDKDFNAELITDFGANVGLIELTPQEIGRVLLNLYNNAFYVVREKQTTAPSDYQPTVSVSTRQVNGQTEIRVHDNGTGIHDAVRAKIFQPFFTTKPTGQGTGLGLSLSYDIITKGHGGNLTVESQEGQGSTFVIQLPSLS